MNGSSHALTGIAVGLWSSLPAAHFAGLDGAGQAVWVATVAGFAIAPDIDHPGSLSARMWGPLTQIPARVVSAVFGHRGATHRVAAAAATGAAVWAAASFPWALAFVVAFTAGLFLAGVRGVIGAHNFGVSWSAAGAAMSAGWAVWWLPVPAAVGVLVHIVGDSLTKTGAPTRDGRWGLRLFRTGGLAETLVVAATVAVIGTYLYLYGIPNIQGAAS